MSDIKNKLGLEMDYFQIIDFNELIKPISKFDESLEDLQKFLVKEMQETKTKFGANGGWEEHYKGTCLETYLNLYSRKEGFSEEEIGWKKGSHASGKDLMGVSVKSFSFSTDSKFRFGGSRSTESNMDLEQKLLQHNNVNFDAILGVGVRKDELRIMLLSSDIDCFKTNSDDWEKTISKRGKNKGQFNGFKTKKLHDGISMTISESMSFQFWYSCPNLNNLPKGKYKYLRAKI